MAVVIVKGGLAGLNRQLARDMKARETRIKKGIRRTAEQGAAYVRRNMPVAFGVARSAVQADDHRIFDDAPHAAALETGSRPHWPPLEPIVAWVRLRGLQGLASDRALGHLPGTTTGGAAVSVNAAIGEHAIARDSRGRATAIDIDAPEKIARAIQASIAKNGTKPTWYMRDSLPEVMKFLDANLRAAMPD